MSEGIRETEKMRTPEEQGMFQKYDEMVCQGDFVTSGDAFVKAIREEPMNEVEGGLLRRMSLQLIWPKRNAGFGYASSSSKGDVRLERVVTGHVARSFLKREVPPRPIIVPIDRFYTFLPEYPSIVKKVLRFDSLANIQNPGEDFAIVLTGFSDSFIFTEKILQQIPTQNHAMRQGGFSEKLDIFARNKLPELLDKTHGDFRSTVKSMQEKTGAHEEDVKLLIATGLLLQDRQMWQDLWYERRKRGTMLYIVAPRSFHDAMNRLNESWGHGAIDYHYRASCSLGANNEPPLESDSEKTPQPHPHDQGISSEEFQKRVGPILSQLDNGTA